MNVFVWVIDRLEARYPDPDGMPMDTVIGWAAVGYGALCLVFALSGFWSDDAGLRWLSLVPLAIGLALEVVGVRALIRHTGRHEPDEP